MKRAELENGLASLNRLRETPRAPGADAALGRALASTEAPLVAAAANIVADGELEGFEPALIAGFERFLERPIKSDPGCHAKTAVARALYRTGAHSSSVFLRGVHHVQLEPVWGGKQDTAVELRGTCALGLVRCGYPDAMVELAELLADAEPMARTAAAHAIAYSERTDVGVPLLRHKVLCGDPDSRVLGACLSGLLGLAPDSSLPLVARFARGDRPELREVAMLALGESRLEAALPVLRQIAEAAVTTEERDLAMLAIALMRADKAWDYLIGQIADGTESQAMAALDALVPYRGDASLCERALTAATLRRAPRLFTHARKVLERDH
jgi:hypothetical protein